MLGTHNSIMINPYALIGVTGKRQRRVGMTSEQGEPPGGNAFATQTAEPQQKRSAPDDGRDLVEIVAERLLRRAAGAAILAEREHGCGFASTNVSTPPSAPHSCPSPTPLALI